MQITVICSTCQKRYKVDSKLGGKKLKCKACGALIAVPVLETAAGGDDLLAGLTAAAAAEQKAPAAPAPGPAGGSKARGVAKPAGIPLESEEGSGEMDFADSPCPQCGRALPTAARFCASCGFDRNAPKPAAAAQPVGAPRPAAAPRATSAPLPRELRRKMAADRDVDSSGIRLLKPYENPFLNFLDTWIPKISFLLFLIWIGYALAVPWIERYKEPEFAPSIGKQIGMTFASMIFYTIALWIILWFTARGVRFAGKFMKFHTPEDMTNRILAVLFLPFFLAYVIVTLIRSAAEAGDDNVRMAAVIALAIAFLISLAAFIPVSFLTFWFFFRLKIKEALLGYPMMMIWFALGIAADIVLLVAIGFVISKLFGAARSFTM
jgi:hypothetical protein